MVRAIGIGGQVAASVRCTELQVREAVERSFHDHVREENGGFQGIADHVAQHAIPLYPVADTGGHGAVLRMHENESLHLLSLGPKGIEFRRR